jgi:hypothetical protein
MSDCPAQSPEISQSSTVAEMVAPGQIVLAATERESVRANGSDQPGWYRRTNEMMKRQQGRTMIGY